MHRRSIAHERGQPKFEYSRITPSIWIGTNQCCTTHFSHALRRLGIRADISLEAEQLDAAYGAKCFLWLPIQDHHAPTPVQLRVGVHALDALVALGQRVYVNCRNGHGRAPTLVAAYLIASEGLTVAQAVALIYARRPRIHLEPIQLRALNRFAKATSHVQ